MTGTHVPEVSATKNLETGGNWQQKTPSGGDGAKERVKGVESDQKPADSGDSQQNSETGAAKASVAVSPPVPADANLQAICEAWPTLPDAMKDGILGMVNAASGAKIEAR